MIAVAVLGLGLIGLINGQSTVNQPVITSITGCTQNGNQSIGCSSSQQITIFGANLNAKQALVTVNNTQCMYPWNPSQSINQYSQLVCQLLNFGLGTNELLPVRVFNLLDNTVSEPANLVSVSPMLSPIVYSFTGCGQSINQPCNISDDVITVIGDNFTQDNIQYAFLTATTKSWIQSISSYQNCLTVINSTALSFCLNTTNWYAPLPNTGKLTFFLSHGSMIANQSINVYFNVSTAISIGTPPASRSNSTMIITGISGCIDQINQSINQSTNQSINITTTSGCVKPAEFILTGSGFVRSGLLIMIGNERCLPMYNGNINRTSINCQLTETMSNMPRGEALPVIVYDLYNNVQSVPFYGVTFVDTLAPIITGVTGCDDQSADQPTTLNCDSSASITLSGSNFESRGQTWSLITAIPNQYSMTSFSLPTGSLLDDSTIIIPLSLFQPYMASILSTSTGSSMMSSNIGGSMTSSIIDTPSYNRTLSLCLKVGNLMTLVSNCFRVQFAAPVMNVTSINGCTPVYSNNQSTSLELVNCLAGTSLITITGNNLFEPLIVYIGGVACMNLVVYSTGVQCQLPTIPDYEPNFAYDLMIYQSTQSISYLVTGAISFSMRPTINSITSQFCPSDPRSQISTLRCDSGDVLTIFGSFFNQSINQSIMIQSSTFVIECLNTSVVYEDQLTCVLPSLDLEMRNLISNVYVNVYVIDNTTGIVSNVVQSIIYRSSNDPSIIEVHGCESINALDRSATGCKTSQMITINGVNFNSLLGAWSTQSPILSLFDTETLGYYNGLNVTIVNSTQVIAVLPYIHRSSSIDLMAIQLTLPTRNWARSNWFYGVEYSNVLPTGINTTIIIEQSVVHLNDYETPYIIALSVLVPITVMLLIMFIVAIITLHKLRRVLKPVREESVGESEMNISGKYDRHSDIEMS